MRALAEVFIPVLLVTCLVVAAAMAGEQESIGVRRVKDPIKVTSHLPKN